MSVGFAAIRLEPRRIASVPGIVLDVLIGGELPAVDVFSVPRTVQELSLSTPPPSRTPYNPVYDLEERAMENYNHIERPTTSQLAFQGPQVISALDQEEGDGGHRTLLSESQHMSGTTSTQRCDSPQENNTATSMDLMQTMIRASQGDADAQVTLGDRYKRGDGVNRDRQAALDWYLTAAEQGHAHAQCNIGLLFCADISLERMVYYEQYCGDSVQDNGDSELDGDDDIPRDRAEGLEWCLKAAHQGLAAAQFAVAMFMFTDSNFDQANPDQTCKSAIIGWARKAAEQNHTVAQGFMRAVYVGGIDDPKARSQVFELLFKEGINRSGGYAECGMGWLYKSGGVLLDDLTAFEWFVKGAEQGSDMAQYEVARCYEEGRGVSKNYEKAVDWYTKASQKGHHQAKRDLDRLTAKLEGLSVGDATGLCVGLFYSVVVMVVGVIILQQSS
ncbi:hypothetical protein BGX24_004132 [Mortierella sp. AD032]|nr:hypothetical protein BGX24_004132 [Mortierella sp. AD032]